MSKPLVTELKRSKYRLLGLVGQGQFGRVFCAMHRKTGRLVALKDLDRERFPTHKFLRELRFLLQLSHPNIVTCQALEHARTGRYLVMDYCEGGTLRNLMESEQGLNAAQSLKIVADVLTGLDHAHSRGIVHCDIKPENILLSIQPQGVVARISDFGIARLSQEIAQEEGNTGSPAYMAPERFYGQYSFPSDLYAVGVMLFELLVGDRPFSGTPTALMSAHLNSPVKVPPQIPEELQAIIVKSLQKLPARRFHSAAEMLIAVQTAAAILDIDLDSIQVPAQLDNFPLCRAVMGLPLSPFQTVQEISLSAPVHHLTAIPTATGEHQLYQVIQTEQGYSLEVSHLHHGDLRRLQLVRRVSLGDDQVQQLVVRSQGCFVITHQSIYLLPLEQTQPPRLLIQFVSPFQAAIAKLGRWLGTVQQGEKRNLAIWKIPHLPPFPPTGLQPLRQRSLSGTHPLIHVLSLDNRHIALFSRADQGTVLEVCSRRGQLLGRWELEVKLQQLVSGTVPYRLLGLEPTQSQTALLIDLKPFRLNRVYLGIQASLIVAMSWGYILSDLQGHLVFLNDHGERVGQVDPPLELLTETAAKVLEIAPLDDHHLLMSTWNAERQSGHLYLLDLKALDIDLLF